jgi:pyridoxine 5-phosphate synthase
VKASFVAVAAGADGITVHLREDRRHIQEHDVRVLRETLTVPLNLEMAATQNMLKFALQVQPEKCCIVPEKREELTTEGGLNVCAGSGALADTCAELSERGIEVSLFIDPDQNQIEAAAALGVPVIELHTGSYALATDGRQQDREFKQLEIATDLAIQAGLQVNAGHGLNFENVSRIVSISRLTELNIGHSIIAQALFDGLTATVKEMKRLIQRAAL